MSNSNVSFRQLRAFLIVADMRSFTRAAEALGITQSGLSILIKELEKEVEVQLFDRHSRSVELTQAGQEMYPHARRTVNSLHETLDAMREVRHVKRGRIKVGVPQTLACTHMPLAVARFQAQYPQIEVTLKDGLLSDHLAHVRAGDLDLAIGPDVPESPEIDARLVFRCEVVLVCSPEHQLAGKKTVNWQQLAGHHFISPSSHFMSSLVAHVGSHLPGGITFGSIEVVDYMTTAIGMAKAGLGITVCPDFASELINAYGLVILPLRNPKYLRGIYAYRSSRRGESPALKAFTELLANYF